MTATATTITTLQLLRAAEQGHLPTVQRFLRHDQNPNHNHSDTTASIDYDDSSDSSANNNNNNNTVNVSDSLDGTALDAASRAGHDDVVAWLIQAGANVHVKQRGGWRPLHSACRAGHTAIVQRLLRAMIMMGNRHRHRHHHSCDVATARLANGQTALHVACAAGHLPVVELLLSTFHHHHHHHDDDDGSGDEYCRVALLQAVDKRGWTALHTAAFYGQVAIVKHLVMNQQQLHDGNNQNNAHEQLQSIKTKDGYTAFGLVACHAKRHEHRLPVLSLLLGANTALVESNEAYMALQNALQRRDLALTRFLLAAGTIVRKTHFQAAGQWPNALYPLLRTATSQGYFVVARVSNNSRNNNRDEP